MQGRTGVTGVRSRRVYSLRMSQRLMYLGVAAVLVASAVAISSPKVDPISLTVGSFLATAGLILALLALRSRLTLEGDRLELRSALRTRSVRRDDIDGLQQISNRYGTSTRIFLKDHGGILTVSGAFTGNDDLEEWLNGLPDIDERNAARIEKMLDTQSGAGSQKHEELLGRARTWMLRLSIAAGVACAAAAVPYLPVYSAGMATLLVFPVVAAFLLYRYPLLFTVLKAKVDPRADLGLLIFLPATGVLLQRVFESDPSHLVDPDPLIRWYALVLVVFIASLAPIVWKTPARRGGVFLTMILGVAYSVGLVNAVDTLPDSSIPSFFRTWIVKKYVHQGSRSTTYYLRVAPWGPFHYPDDVSVSMSAYHRSDVGAPVCVSLHRGFLHAAWYELAQCAALSGRDVALSVPQTPRDASALLADAQRDAARRPRDAHAQFVLGECLVELQRLDEALPPLLAAERLDSTDAWSRSVIGWILGQQGHFAEALPHLRAAVALDSTYGQALQNLAWTYLKLNDLADADSTYRVVVRLEPKSAEAAFEYAWELERRVGAQGAEAEIVRALQLEPKNGRIQAFAGYVFRSEAKFADARQHYEEASRLLPDDAAVWAELGETDYLMNDRSAAAAAFANSVRLDANYVRSRPNLVQMWRDVAPGKAT